VFKEDVKPFCHFFSHKHFWAAAGLLETSIRLFSLRFELHWTEIAQCLVLPLGIIEALDVISLLHYPNPAPPVVRFILVREPSRKVMC